ncbi:hypothetical protein IAU60_000166 [Kwoniella sp. DSM 27419]
MAEGSSSTSPSDAELQAAASSLREAHPSLGIPKLLAQLKLDHSDWLVSEKRFRKFVSTSPVTAPGQDAAQIGTIGEGEKPLIALTGLDTSIDVAGMAPKVKVKMFTGGKGKGLVAKDKMLGGEMIWQEDPWIVTPDPGLYPYLTTRQMCSQCFNLFPQPAPPLSVPCAYCSEAHFCNRLCQAKARQSGHNDLLCPGQNKEVASLMRFVREKKARSVDAVARILARWRSEREWGEEGKADEIDRRVWGGMARISQKDKEAERREWEFIGSPRLEEWHFTHMLLLKVLNPSPKDENHKPFQKLLTSKKKAKPVPLTKEEEDRWFSFEAFLQLLGLVGLNQEDSGGLYALHAHVNHSCEPNVQVRNLPKTWTPPTSLPAGLPLPMHPSNRGTNKLTMLARKTIHPGEELTISYVDQRLGRDERRTALREGYGFWCICPRCVREKKEAEKDHAQAQQ